MRILDRHIATTLIKGYAVTLFILLALFSVLALVQELEDVGDGDYRLPDAFVYVGLTLPRRLLELAPVTVLLGGLLGLGQLRRDNELTAIRMAGVSVYRFGWSVAKLNLLIVTLLVSGNQFLIPPLTQLAEKQRIVATKGQARLLKGKGFWARDRQQVLHFRGMWQGQVPSRITLYKFDTTGKLLSYIHADRARISAGDNWRLMNVHEKSIGDDSITNRTSPSENWKSFLKTSQLAALQLPLDSLSPAGLHQYAAYLRETGQQSSLVELIFWQKLLAPLGAGVMSLIAVPFAFGNGNKRAAGGRFLLGTLVGAGFFLLGQVVSGLGMLAGFSPPLIAVLPLAVITGFAGYLYRRVA